MPDSLGHATSSPDSTLDAVINALIAAHSPAELAAEVLRLQARCKQAEEDRDDTKDVMTAWFDQRRLDENQLEPLFLDASRGFLRRCRSGGMPRKLSDKVESLFEQFSRLYLVSALEPVLRKLREAAPASLEAPTPPEPPALG